MGLQNEHFQYTPRNLNPFGEMWVCLKIGYIPNEIAI